MSRLVLRQDIGLKSSLEWVKFSFWTFREEPLQFIVLGVVSTLMSLLPLFGAFMSPLFIARYAHLAHMVEDGQEIKLSRVFVGLFDNSVVVRLAFINFCLASVIFIGQYLFENLLISYGVDGQMVRLLILAAFFIPVVFLQMSMWLSPVICSYNDVSPKSAMWLSIKAGIYNISTLLLYTLLILGCTLLALLPVGLGLFIWLPILNITAYHIYKSLFILAD